MVSTMLCWRTLRDGAVEASSRKRERMEVISAVRLRAAMFISVALIPLQEVGVDGAFEERGVAGDDGQTGRSDKVVALVLDRIVADDGALGNMHVAVDDGAADAAVAANVHVR